MHTPGPGSCVPSVKREHRTANTVHSVYTHTQSSLGIVRPRPRQPDFYVNIIIINKMQKRFHPPTAHAHTRKPNESKYSHTHNLSNTPNAYAQTASTAREVIRMKVRRKTNHSPLRTAYNRSTIASPPMFTIHNPTQQCIF